jgi:small GTP-binding protein
LQWDERTSVRLQLWDIAGQERFGHMTRVYYKEAVGAMVVFDVTRSGTFDAVQKWKQDIDGNLSTPERALPCILLANKCDLAKEPLDKEKMDAYIEQHGFVAWFETSAKEDIGIKKAFNAMVGHILANDPDVQQPNDAKPGAPGAFKLGAANGDKANAKVGGSSKSCC